MGKKLSEMSLEELWQLFPIFLVPHDDAWKLWYENEEQRILTILPHGMAARISHVGSTAIPGIYAKNIVDIMLEVAKTDDLYPVSEILQNNGWICMNRAEKRISLNKGYTENGFAEKVFHLHLRLQGDNDELYFRDYLVEYPDAAKEYEELKLRLWKQYEHDRDGYTMAKGSFIQKYTVKAREYYGMKY